MKTNLIKTSLTFTIISILCACSLAKFEARLEANPQCKDLINPKTGALMPCPGSDKAFYREVGLAPANPAPAVNNTAASSRAAAGASAIVQAPSQIPAQGTAGPAITAPLQGDCKPQIHKKTGGTLPCPAAD